MNFLEKNLEDIIFNTRTFNLFERGLDIIDYSSKKRQLKIGNYGIADIVLFGKDYDVLNINVLELKKDTINIESLMQAARYVKGIDSYIRRKRRKEIEVQYTITLIGASLELNSSFVHLTDVLTENGFDLRIYTYQYEFDGIKFNRESDFYLKNEGF